MPCHGTYFQLLDYSAIAGEGDRGFAMRLLKDHGVASIPTSAFLYQSEAPPAGHGGMDYIEDYRLIDALQQGRALDLDVYDAASWSAVTALSERSVASKGAPVDFPDFTRGQWKTPRVLHVMEV